MNTLQRCTECGGFFQFLPRGVCGSCLEEIERDYEVVRDHLRGDPRATMHDLAGQTGVDEDRIRTFIAEGRLEFRPSDVEAVASSTCEMCGAPVFQGRHCEQCRARLVHGLSDAGHADTGHDGHGRSGGSSRPVHRGMYGRRGS